MTWLQCKEWREVRFRRRLHSVVQVAGEAYLRSDLPCGAAACPVCPETRPGIPRDADHLVVPDAAALATLLEVFELPDMADFVLLSSVLHQLAQKGGMQRSARIRALYGDARRRCALVDNLHFAPVAPSPAELPRRGDLLRAGQWLAEHLGLPVVLLSDALCSALGGGSSGSGGTRPEDGGSAKDTAGSQPPTASQPAAAFSAVRSETRGLRPAEATCGSDDFLDELLGDDKPATPGQLQSAQPSEQTAAAASSSAGMVAPASHNGILDDDLLDGLLGSGGSSSKSRLLTQPPPPLTHGGMKVTPSRGAEDSDDLLDELLGSVSDGDDFLGVPPAQLGAPRPTGRQQPLPEPARTSAGRAPAALSFQDPTPARAAADAGIDSDGDGADLLGTLLDSQTTTTKRRGPALARPSSSTPAAAPAPESAASGVQPKGSGAHGGRQAAEPVHDHEDGLLAELLAEDDAHRRVADASRKPRPRPRAPGADAGVELFQGVVAMTAAQYFRAHWSHCPAVLDVAEALLAAATAKAEAAAGGRGGGQGREYAPHLGPAGLDAGIASGTLLQGTIHMGRRGPREATVQLGSGSGSGGGAGRQVAVDGRPAINRAVHGDRVAVRLLPRSQWRPANPDMHPHEDSLEPLTGDDEAAGLPAEDDTDEGASVKASAAAGAAASQGLTPTGEVVGILQRPARDIVASLLEADEAALRSRPASSRQEAVLCAPMDRRLPLLRLRTRRGPNLVGCRFLLRLDAWPPGSQFPEAHLVRILGGLGDLQAEKEAILIGAGVTRQPWAPAAMAELPPEGPWAPSPEDLAARRDLRGPEHLIASIDPPGCTDVDDALSARELPDGRLQLGVHIADVSAFVRQGGALDAEAAARGTTVYLVDERLDMLPERLSADLCSLLGGVDRPAVSVLWTLGADDFGVQDVWFGRTIIRSRHQLSYQQAQDLLDGKSPTARSGGESLISAAGASALRPMLALLTRVTDAWRQRRLEAGALELESAELRFETSADGRDAEVRRKQELPMMRTVAEAMIAANSAVAEFISAAFPAAALLRRHPAPLPDAFAEVEGIMAASGVALDVSSNRALAASLAAVAAAVPQSAPLVRALATRAMSEAQYFSTGEPTRGGGGGGHFGLALAHYTHFTSPIRRYADLLVHRQLLAALAARPQRAQRPEPPLRHAALTAAAARLNEATRGAKRAQRDCSDLYLLLLLHREPHVEAAVVYAVRPDALLVFVPEYHVRGALRLTDRNGSPVPPEAEEEGEADVSARDALAAAQRRQMSLETGDGWARIRASGGGTLLEVRAPQRVWLRMSADASRAHGPALKLRLLADSHPAARRAAATAAQHAAEQNNGMAAAKQHQHAGGSNANHTAGAAVAADEEVFPWLADDRTLPATDSAAATKDKMDAQSNGARRTPDNRPERPPKQPRPKVRGTSGRAASIAAALQLALQASAGPAGGGGLSAAAAVPATAAAPASAAATSALAAQAACSQCRALVERGFRGGLGVERRQAGLRAAEAQLAEMRVH